MKLAQASCQSDLALEWGLIICLEFHACPWNLLNVHKRAVHAWLVWGSTKTTKHLMPMCIRVQPRPAMDEGLAGKPAVAGMQRWEHWGFPVVTSESYHQQVPSPSNRFPTINIEVISADTARINSYTIHINFTMNYPFTMTVKTTHA